jgi:hypothetical protein
MLPTTFGPFSFDGISVQGPKDYLEARGLALLDAILSGEDQEFDPGSYPDEEEAVLARLEEVYRSWMARPR